MLKKLNTFTAFLFTGLLISGFLFNSCEKEEEKDSSVQVISWGPSPALRGGELKFIGQNLDKVTSIVLPVDVTVNTFTTHTKELIKLTVPEEVLGGDYVTLKTTEGDILTMTLLLISEPISIDTIYPGTIRPGDVLTIEGDYLNLIASVIFKDNKVVTENDFVSQTQTKIEVTVPADAQSGIVVISNGETEPILIESTSELNVILPAITQMASSVKAGTDLTLQGTDLDLAVKVIFGGNKIVETFVSQTATSLVVTVPDDAKPGVVTLVAASGLTTVSPTILKMVAPTITGVAPNPAKNGEIITVTGTNLDLITSATFGGDVEGTLLGGTDLEITVEVPETAVEDTVWFATAADTSVPSPGVLELIEPVFTSFSPTTTPAKTDIVIVGTDLDLVADVVFTGGVSGTIKAQSDVALTVTVPLGAKDGVITLVAVNGVEVESADPITVPANLPTFISYGEAQVAPGEILTINGTDLLLVKELIFPGDVYATAYGIKTDNQIQVYVPMNATKGLGQIKLITYEGEEGLWPEILISGTDPVLDPAMVFFDFDGKNSWWGGVVIENEPALSLDGSNYGRLNGDFSGWTDLFWRNGSDNFPGNVIGTNVDDYVMKFDINVLEPITGGNLKFKLQPADVEFWWTWGPAATPAGRNEVIEVTPGWVTITVPISDFTDNYNWGSVSPTDLSGDATTFGAAWDNGDSKVNIAIDNIRFEYVGP